MLKKYGTLLSAVLILTGLLLLLLCANRTVILTVNGATQTVQTGALTTASVLLEAGVDFNAADRVSPAPGGFLPESIRVDRARSVQIVVEPGGTLLNLVSAESIPANLIQQAGIRLFPGDRVRLNGMEISADLPLFTTGDLRIELRQAQPVTLTENGQTRVIYSSAPTLGAALAEAGITLRRADRLEPAPDTLLNSPMEATLTRAVRLTIAAGGTAIQAASAAETVGEALAGAGIALQGADYSLPAEDQPLPADGMIRVVRVREETQLSETFLPYEKEYIEDPETELDQRSVVSAGQPGIQVSRVVVRYEDGAEVSRRTDAQWTAQQPVTEKVGYGTKVVIRTMDTPDGTIEYWRAVPVYVTSYSPCRSGGTRCYYGTSSGLPVQRGVIGVTRAWYSWMSGQRLYVPGYGSGVIADVGGGVSGRYWIDLGYTDDTYQAWSSTVTVYFLTPVPATIPWILP